MGFRARKTMKIAPGIKMTVSKGGVSYSAGVKGARVTRRADGSVTRTLSAPGAGISHTKSVRPASGSRSGSQTPSPAASPALPTPGFMAPRWEKALHAAVSKQDAGKIVEVGRQYEEARLHSALFEAILGGLPAGQSDRRRHLLQDVFSSGFDPAADRFFTKYFPRMGTSLGVAEGVQVTLPLDRQTIGLIYAEILQEAGDLDTAIAVVEDLEPTTIAAVSLAELYGEQGRWDEVISLTDGLTNEDEPSTYLLIQRGIGLREMGMFAASRETLKEALRVRTRPAEMRHRALLERAGTYRAEGKNGMARKDLEKVFAEDSTYPGLREALDALAGA